MSGHVNRVELVGVLSRRPELRTLADGRSVASFTVTTVEEGTPEKVEHHMVVAWDDLGIVVALLDRFTLVRVVGRLVTRQWEDERKMRHWRTEVVATGVETL